jgi:hypothetical protein
VYEHLRSYAYTMLIAFTRMQKLEKERCAMKTSECVCVCEIIIGMNVCVSVRMNVCVSVQNYHN